MKYLLGVLMIVVVLGTAYLIFNQTRNSTVSVPNKAISTSPTSEEKGEYKAVFAVYTNGTFRIFTDPKYHNLSGSVFISSGNPNVINVKKKETTWAGFFSTLPMKLEKDCLTTGTGQVFCSNETSTLKFFINGQRDDDALLREIKKNDRLLVSYGPREDNNIQSQLDKLNSY